MISQQVRIKRLAWAEALESGAFKQAKYCLVCPKTGNCSCLGVGVCIGLFQPRKGLDLNSVEANDDPRNQDDDDTILGWVDIEIDEFMELNDDLEASFSEVASIIRYSCEEKFESFSPLEIYDFILDQNDTNNEDGFFEDYDAGQENDPRWNPRD